MGMLATPMILFKYTVYTPRPVLAGPAARPGSSAIPQWRSVRQYLQALRQPLAQRLAADLQERRQQLLEDMIR